MFFDIAQFPPLVFLQKNWQIIADECNALNRDNVYDTSLADSREDVAKYLVTRNKPQWISGWDNVDTWLNWGIIINYMFPLGDTGLPKTANLLRNITGIKFADLSLFRGGTVLPWHEHPEMHHEGLLTFHLGLDVPYGCGINVNGRNMMEKNGKPIIFNGAVKHYAYNESPKDRLIFYCEFCPEKLGFVH